MVQPSDIAEIARGNRSRRMGIRSQRALVSHIVVEDHGLSNPPNTPATPRVAPARAAVIPENALIVAHKLAYTDPPSSRGDSTSAESSPANDASSSDNNIPTADSASVSHKTHSNNTSPSTDGTISSGFTEDISGVYGKVMTFGEQEQVYYLNKNSTNPFSLLYVYNLPHNLTYNEVHKLVEAFGELKYVNWSPFDPLIAEVMYLNTPATQRAANALNGHRMFAGYNVLRAKVVSADAAYKVIVKNLRTECTEELLEKDFAAIVGSKVTAIIKVDPEHNIPLGYAILSFATLDAAHIVLEKGNGLCIQGNPITIEPYSQHDSPAYVHLTGLRHDATAEEIAELTSNISSTTADDIAIARRSYAFIKFARREGAESAKRVLQYNDSKEFKVRYAEGEQTRSTLVVQFQHAEDADMESVRQDAAVAFGKFGDCTIKFERWDDNKWRGLVFVTYKGNEEAVVNTSAALLKVTKVGKYSVWCQLARELIPRISPGHRFETTDTTSHINSAPNRRNNKQTGAAIAPIENETSAADTNAFDNPPPEIDPYAYGYGPYYFPHPVPPGVAPPTAAEMVQVVVPAVPPPAVPMNMNVMNPMAQVNYQNYQNNGAYPNMNVAPYYPSYEGTTPMMCPMPYVSYPGMYPTVAHYPAAPVYYPPYAFANEYAPAEGAHQTNPTADAAYSQDNGVADVPSG